MAKEGLYLKGYATIRLIKDGKVIKETKVNNKIVNTGKELIAKLLNGVSSTPFLKIAIGTNNIPPSVSDTALGSQYDIKDATVSYESDYKANWEATFTFSSDVTIREAGVFVDDGGIMLDRLVFADQNVGVGIDFNIKITVEVQEV